MPLAVLYRISDVLAPLLFYVIPYRKKVVMANLRRSFPERSEHELKKLGFAFYRHFCDILIEGVRLFSMPRKEILKRFVVLNPEVTDRFYDEGRSLVVVGAHYNNWEILASGINDQIRHQAVGIYARLENAFFNKKFMDSRSKHGLHLISTKEVAGFFATPQPNPTFTLFASDQSPTYNKTVYWTNFLGQDTAVATGTERFARKYDQPVIYGNIDKVKRGYYTLTMEVLFEHPSETAEGEISEAYTRKIETQIKADPRYWLWTHKRWKRKRKDNE